MTKRGERLWREMNEQVRAKRRATPWGKLAQACAVAAEKVEGFAFALAVHDKASGDGS